MAIFETSTNTQAKLKAGLMGFAGDGKTFTAALIAIGLIQYLRDRKLPGGDKPVMFLDTETGSDWVKPKFDAAGIELRVAKTRAFTKLVPAIEEAEKEGALLMIDSISHFWRELTESYARKKNRTKGLIFQDWAWLKEQWGHFTDAFVNSQCHIIMCGRAGYEYNFFENEEGKKELEKTGVKMKAETETGYEPSILILMEKHRDKNTGEVWRTGSVLKDRADIIDGKTFRNPTFNDFLPHIQYLNLGGEHIGVNTSENSSAIVPTGEKPQWQYDKEQKEIALDEVTEKLKQHFPSQSSADKEGRKALMEKVFGTRAWSRITTLRRDEIETGRNKIYLELDGKPYHFTPPVDLEDDIPYSDEDQQKGSE